MGTARYSKAGPINSLRAVTTFKLATAWVFEDERPTDSTASAQTHTVQGTRATPKSMTPVWLPCLWAHYQADFPHVMTMQRNYRRGRKKTQQVPGGEEPALTQVTGCFLTEARVASPRRAPRTHWEYLRPSVKQRHHLLSRPGKLRLTGYGNLRDLTGAELGFAIKAVCLPEPLFPNALSCPGLLDLL